MRDSGVETVRMNLEVRMNDRLGEKTVRMNIEE